VTDRTAGATLDGRSATLVAVERFNDAFGRQDIDATLAAMTDDCVFENTNPAPDGTRHEGRAAVRRAFQEFFDSSPNARFEAEATLPAGDHCVVLWRYGWTDDAGRAGHVRGVDIFRIRDGLIAAKLSYVKG
jgi:ketosteroid isomerase-like protein